ncbi:hypothetical protein ACFL5O_00005, partial [Myxococcota bacterium]
MTSPVTSPVTFPAAPGSPAATFTRKVTTATPPISADSGAELGWLRLLVDRDGYVGDGLYPLASSHCLSDHLNDQLG